MLKENLNLIRTLPVYWCVLHSPHKALVEKDLQRWLAQDQKHFPSDLAALNHYLTHRPEFRNLLIHRLWNPSRTKRCRLHAFIARRLWKPMDTLYLNTRCIGGGLYIQHGFATIVAARSVGDNCWINQQVTIGYSGDEAPVLKDNVCVYCGAKVLGGITMAQGSAAAAGAVVLHDVPENTLVGGVPAKIIKHTV